MIYSFAVSVSAMQFKVAGVGIKLSMIFSV